LSNALIWQIIIDIDASEALNGVQDAFILVHRG
jgi:hypothetical protein